MAQREARIAQDLVDEPHIAGRRVPVLTLVERVESRGLDPRTVAERYDLDVADVYAALLYYHEHPDEFEELRQERQAILETIESEIERPDDVAPPNA